MTPTPLSRRSDRNCSVHRGFVMFVKPIVGTMSDFSDETKLISELREDRSRCHEETSSGSLPDARLSLRAVNLCVSWIGPGPDKDCISSLFSNNMELIRFVEEMGRGPATMAIMKGKTR